MPTRAEIEAELARRGAIPSTDKPAMAAERPYAGPTPPQPAEMQGLYRALGRDKAPAAEKSYPELDFDSPENTQRAKDAAKTAAEVALVASMFIPGAGPAALGARVASKALPAAVRAALKRGAGKVAGKGAQAATAARVGPAGPYGIGATGAAMQQAAPQAATKAPGVLKRALSAGKSTARPAGEGAGIGGVMGAIDEDSTFLEGAGQGAAAAIGVTKLAKVAAKFGLDARQAEALKDLTVNSPLGRMGISQIAKKLGVSGPKAATIWYALHPTSRRAMARTAAAFAGTED